MCALCLSRAAQCVAAPQTGLNAAHVAALYDNLDCARFLVGLGVDVAAALRVGSALWPLKVIS